MVIKIKLENSSDPHFYPQLVRNIQFFAIVSHKSAFKTGGRWPWFFFATMSHGFVVELISYFSPFINNFWHAQSILMLFDRRMPLYIAIICKANIYA